MTIFNLKSGKQIDTTRCWRFQNYWENQDDQHLGSYDRIIGEIKSSDYYEPKYTGYSDYSGAIEYKSNQQILLEKFGDLDGVLNIYGGYDTSLLFIRIDVLDSNEELQKMIFALEDYPILDEFHLSEIEEEAKEEALEHWVLSDFRRKLEKEWNYDFNYLNDDFMACLFSKCEEKTNTYWVFEYTDAYIDIDKMLNISREDFLDIFRLVKEDFTKDIKKE